MNWLVSLVVNEHGQLERHVIFALSERQAWDIAERLSHILVKGIESVVSLDTH